MILGIETSCDETSVALLERDGTVRVNLIASQIERHQPFGGVVPEIASREHLQHLFPLITRALTDAKLSWNDVDRIVISGGHSSIYDVRDRVITMLNRTRDDAIGETFDKVAKFIGLPYPGGPQIEKHAMEGNIDRDRFALPIA